MNRLAKRNGFQCDASNGLVDRRMDAEKQKSFYDKALNATKGPKVVIRHLYFVNFEEHERKNPIYVNQGN